MHCPQSLVTHHPVLAPILVPLVSFLDSLSTYHSLYAPCHLSPCPTPPSKLYPSHSATSRSRQPLPTSAPPSLSLPSSPTARPLLPARSSPRAIIMSVDQRLVRTAIRDHFPQFYILRPFCVELLTSPYDRENRVLVGVTYRKLVDNLSASQHESVILHTAVMSPNAVAAGEVPPGPPSRRYIEVARFSEPSLLKVLGTARDEVFITEHNPISDHNRHERLGEIIWQSLPPPLVDVFAIIKQLSIRYPQYDILLRQCYWFARMIYQTLVTVYPHGLQTFGELFWKGGRFFGIPVPSWLTSPPADIIACARFEKECADSDRARLGTILRVGGRGGTNRRRRAASI